jgi:hypothetical protein
MKEMASKPRPAEPIHLILLKLHSDSIVYGRVSLFSGFTYHITLSTTASAETVPEEMHVGLGHIFDLKKGLVRKVSPKLLSRFNNPIEESGSRDD